MANTSITTSFVGTGAMDFISAAILEAKTITGGYVQPITQIKKSYKLQIASADNLIQADGCSFNDQGTVTLSERSLTPVHLKVNHQECKTTLEAHWQSASMRPGALNSTLTPNYESWLAKQMTDQVAIGIDQLIWQGKISGSTGIYLTKPFLTSIDGLITTAIADSNTLKVTGTTLTSGNILAEVEKVYVKIPDTVLEKGNVKIFVPRSALRLFQTAIPTTYTANSNFDITKPQPVMYKGVELVAVPLADNIMFAADPNNLFIGTDLTDDFMNYTVIDMSLTDGSDNIRFKMRFSLDTDYGISSEVVVYS